MEKGTGPGYETYQNRFVIFVSSPRQKPPMNHDRTFRPVPYVPALRLRDADGSMRPHTYGVRVCSCAAIATEPCRPTACAGEYPCCTFTHPATAHHSLLSANSSYTFSAKEKDIETGLSCFESRYYSSNLSVWLSVDPMADKYPSMSPYVYCANNPVKLVDPTGEEIDPESLADNRLSLPLVTRGWMNLVRLP